MVRLDSPGPIFFRQRRMGLRGVAFNLLKFRTMCVDAEAKLEGLESKNESAGGILFKIKRDPRVTRLGAFLRKTSVDELPQLINVLRGEMSLVGPRPLQVRDCGKLEQHDPEGYRARLSVPQGLTGAWQIGGRSAEDCAQMLRRDLDYVENWSLALDLKIILKTVPAVLTARAPADPPHSPEGPPLPPPGDETRRDETRGSRLSEPTAPKHLDPSPAATGPARGPSRPSVRGSAALLVTLLALSGAFRFWQDRRIMAATAAVSSASFALGELPEVIGQWESHGGNYELDAETVRIAGCTSYVARTYADPRTGVSLTILIAYGPAERLFTHTPLVCFPSTGYVMEGATSSRAVSTGRGKARFRSSVFVKSGPLSEDRQEVLFSFRHAGLWSPDASETRKRFRHEPGMYKVQVERRIAPQERQDLASPSVEFLNALLPVIEARINSPAPRRASLASEPSI